MIIKRKKPRKPVIDPPTVEMRLTFVEAAIRLNSQQLDRMTTTCKLMLNDFERLLKEKEAAQRNLETLRAENLMLRNALKPTQRQYSTVL